MKRFAAAIALALLAPCGFASADDAADAARTRQEMMRIIAWDDAYRETVARRNREWMALYNERNAKEGELGRAPDRETERRINSEIVRLEARMEALSGIEAHRPAPEQRLSAEQWQAQVDAMARGIADVRREFDRQAEALIREYSRTGTVSAARMESIMETAGLLERARTLQGRLLPARTQTDGGYASHIEFNRRMIGGTAADYARIDRLAAALGNAIGDADYAALTEQFRTAARQIRQLEQGISLLGAAERGRTGTGTETENGNMKMAQEAIRQALSAQSATPAPAFATQRTATIAPPNRTSPADRNRWGQRFYLQTIATPRNDAPEFYVAEADPTSIPPPLSAPSSEALPPTITSNHEINLRSYPETATPPQPSLRQATTQSNPYRKLKPPKSPPRSPKLP